MRLLIAPAFIAPAFIAPAVVALAFVALALSALPARAAEHPTLDRIRKDGVLHCGSAIRPGLAFPGADNTWNGLHVDVCRAIAAAVIGEGARIEFYGYALRPDFDRIRTGADDVAFLTGSELFAQELFDAVQPGPAVFQQTIHVMVADASPVQHIADLGPTMICAEPGTAAEHSLRTYAAAHRWTLNFSGWMELEEMMDAFDAGRCPAVVNEATALAALRLGSEHNGHPARLLPEPLAASPVLAATPAGDPAWSMVVTWAVNTALGGADALPIAGSWLGLDRGWQARVVAGGSYADLLRRNLGDESPLELPAGLNASWTAGGAAIPPTVD